MTQELSDSQNSATSMQEGWLLHEYIQSKGNDVARYSLVYKSLPRDMQKFLLTPENKYLANSSKHNLQLGYITIYNSWTHTCICLSKLPTSHQASSLYHYIGPYQLAESVDQYAMYEEVRHDRAKIIAQAVEGIKPFFNAAELPDSITKNAPKDADDKKLLQYVAIHIVDNALSGMNPLFGTLQLLRTKYWDPSQRVKPAAETWLPNLLPKEAPPPHVAKQIFADLFRVATEQAYVLRDIDVITARNRFQSIAGVHRAADINTHRMCPPENTLRAQNLVYDAYYTHHKALPKEEAKKFAENVDNQSIADDALVRIVARKPNIINALSCSISAAISR